MISAGLVEPRITVAAHEGRTAGDVERLGRLSELLRVDDVLRCVAPGIEHDAELRLIGRLLPDRVIVEVELDLRAGAQQPAGAFRKQVAVLADRELVEEFAGRFRIAVVAVAVAGHVGVDGVGQQMVNDSGLARLAFDRFDVTVLGETGLDVVAAPPVGRFGRDDMLRRCHDDVRLADVPSIRIVELARLRHVRDVSHRRAGIDPFRDRRDLVVAQRRIVLEALDTDVRIDPPGGICRSMTRCLIDRAHGLTS